MKTLKYVLVLIAGMFILQSCNINEQPVFDDKDAFLAFRGTATSVGEEIEGGVLEIPVLLTSLAGLSGTVEFDIDTTATNTAEEGVNYRILNESGTLTFTKENPTQSIRLSILDNETFDGDVKLTFMLKSPSNGLNLGFAKTCQITITDDEHPLLFILGDNMRASGESYFDGPDQTWTMKFTKDDADIAKVWITNFVLDGSSSSSPVYGTVNAEKTEIRIPVNQVVMISASYPLIRLEGFYGPDGDEKIPDGGYITGEIAEDGTITILDDFGSLVYGDENGTSPLGWFNVFASGVTIKKGD
jgi:hypothetical protein